MNNVRNIQRLLAVLTALLTVLSLLVSCGNPDGNQNTDPKGESTLAPWVDYVSQVKLDRNAGTLQIEATVKSFIDGDTTHFYVDTAVCPDGVLKARYLAINTPESTGKIEEWGKAASKFTRAKLEQATSIILESDNGKWNIDSTGERHLVWVWYKTAADSEYRNLNLEILQEGYAISSNASQNRYGTVCTDAIAQAIAYEKFVYSKELDPDYPYGEAQEVTLKQLRTHIEEYEGALVAFDATVVMNSSGSIIVEEYDSENDMYYGMTVYYGTSGLNGQGLELLTIGNRLRIVGIVSYWETGGVYQVSGLEYNRRDKDNPRNIKLLSEGHTAGYHEVDAKTFVSSVNVMMEEESKVFDYAGLVLNTSISMKDLKVESVYTTPSGDSAGAMTLHCTAQDGTPVDLRTIVLYENGEKVSADYFEGKTIDVKGFVDYFDGDYQIEIYSVNDVTIHH
jgi:endonuclease YncB( thermonuclease family)